MSATVRIPAAMRALVDGRAELTVEAGSVRDVLVEIGGASAELRERVLSEEGELRRHVNVFVNDEDVRFLDQLDTPVRSGDRVTIVPAIAGGR